MLKAWKKFAAKLEVSSPCNAAEVLSTTLWWLTQFYASNFGFSHQHAAKLMRAGLTHVRQLWNPELQQLYTGDELKIIFKIPAQVQPTVTRMLDAFPLAWTQLLTVNQHSTDKHEYLGIFDDAHSTHPSYICGTTSTFQPMLSDQLVHWDISSIDLCYSVGSRSKLLRVVGSPQEVISGWVKRVRVVFVTRSQGRTALTYLLYVGIIQDLVFDPGRFHWTNNLGTLHSYSAKKGRSQILYPRVDLKRPIPEKWHGLLPASYKPNWKEVWVIRRPQKEAAFLWSVYHRAIAVNQWRAQMFNGIPATCVCCPLQMFETVQHRVFECVHTIVIWNYAQSVIFTS
jgi:hypothetical protein